MHSSLLRSSWVVVMCLSSVALAGEKVELKLRLEEGKDYVLEMATDQAVQQQVMGQNQDMVQQMGMGMNYHVLKVNPGTGNMDVKITFTWVSLNQTGSMGALTYDSRTHKGPVPMEAQGFAGLIGSGYEATIEPTGRVAEVRGVEEMFRKMIAGMALPEEQKAMMEPMFKKQFGDEAMRQSMEQFTRIFPDHAVSPGESWQNKAVMGGPMPMSSDTRYTLKEVAGDTVVIDMASTVTPAPADQGGMELPGGVKMTIEMNGEQSGQMTIDRKTGWVLACKLTQNFTGTSTVTMPSAPAPMVMPMTVKGTTTYTGK